MIFASHFGGLLTHWAGHFRGSRKRERRGRLGLVNSGAGWLRSTALTSTSAARKVKCQVQKPRLIFVCGVKECSNFFLFHVAFQFSQHHLLKRLSFFHCMFLPPLSLVSWPQVLGSFPATWMDLEILILSEASQKEKDKYHMISLVCGI